MSLLRSYLSQNRKVPPGRLCGLRLGNSARGISSQFFTEKYPEQTVYGGEGAISPLVKDLLEKGLKKTLLVSDQGLARVGVVDQVRLSVNCMGSLWP